MSNSKRVFEDRVPTFGVHRQGGKWAFRCGNCATITHFEDGEAGELRAIAYELEHDCSPR